MFPEVNLRRLGMEIAFTGRDVFLIERGAMFGAFGLEHIVP